MCVCVCVSQGVCVRARVQLTKYLNYVCVVIVSGSVLSCLFLHFNVALINVILITFLLIFFLAITLLISAFLSAIIFLHILLRVVWTCKQGVVDAESKVSDKHLIEQLSK